ncbi:MAG: carboxypeptidase-like regulatory domain-containing protein [Bacteroidales bacterium]|nr:carboxypeptidase-like regulatory domain-containing protein [Bacteroidales bacterium]MBR3412510.1 carboxypeptidase-like regulatory domain-containing protein [Bacteroidales bacterium]
MKRIIILTLCAALLTLASSCNKIQYDLFGNISGTVIDVDTDEPIAGSTVTLSPGGLNTYTGSDGHFAFNEIDAQQYTITVQKTGYQANRKTIEVLSGETINVSITMKNKQ